MINIDYSPISAALGLAQKAGRADRARQLSHDDLQFLNMINNMQSDADRLRLSEISQALEADEASARLNLAAKQHADDVTFRNTQLAAQTADQNADRVVRQDAINQDREEWQAKQAFVEKQRQQMEQYLLSLPDSPAKQQAVAFFQATGKLPETVIPQNPADRRFNYKDDPEVQKMMFELDNLRDQLTRATRAKKDYADNNILASVGKQPRRPASVKSVEVARLLNRYSQNIAGVAKSRDTEKLERALAAGIPETQYQLRQPDSGKNWYKEDIAKMENIVHQLHPSTKDKDHMVVFKAILAITSQGNNPNVNFKHADPIYRHWIEAGKWLKKQPDGKNWPGTLGPAYALPITRLEKLIEKHGVKGAAEWLLSKHTVQELNEFSENIGLNGNVAGKKADMVYGAEIFGPKIGVFFLNQNGIQEKITKDMWFSRTWNRWMGTMMEGGEIVDAPRNDTERELMDRAMEILSQKLGLDPMETQAILWYYEQQLWKAHGAKAESGSYSKAAEKVLNGDRYDLERAFARRESTPVEEAGEDAELAGVPEAGSGIDAGSDQGEAGVQFLPGQSLLKRGGDLPEAVTRLNEGRVGEIASEHRQAEFRLAQLNRAIKAEYGVPARKLPPADIQKINDALKGQSVRLPAKVLDAVEAMRDHVDELSLQIMGSGLVDPDLAAILGKNLGTYLNRSYRIFDDPQWEKKIPPAVRAAAETLIAGQLAAQGKPASLAKVYVDELIQDWKQGGVESMFAKGRLGAKNLSILKERQDIAPEIRALMGEYNNPFTNYAKSINKMAALLANHQFLEAVKADGMGTYLFDDDTAREGFTTRIAAPGSSAMAPLNGLRTSPEIAKAFEDFNKSQELPGWLRLWTAANFLAKSSKTVFSFMTQMRNLIGQPMFNLLSGHYRIGNYGKAAKTIIADLRNKGTVAQEAYIQKLTKLGVLGQSVYANEILADLKDMGLTDSDVYTESGWLPASKRGVRKALLLPQTAYHVSDSLGKIVGFENELARAKEAYPTLPLEQQEKIAADRVLDTYPTYSRVPPVIQKLRRQPFVGPFVAFWYESFRTVGNSIAYAAQDLASGNKARVRHGAERLAGMTALASGTIAIQALTKALLGIDDEEEADFRKFQPEWSRGDIYAFIGRDGQGNLRHIDVSTLNPYSPLIDSAYAIASGEGSVVQRLSDAAAEFLNSLTSEQIFTKAALDVARNRTENGGRVYNPEDTVVNQWKDALGHLFNAVEPGTLDRLRHRILPGLRGEETAFGDKIRPGDEITAELTGVKMRSFSFESGLAFQARKFQQHQGDIGGLFLRELSRPGKLNATRVTEAYNRMEKLRYEQWSDLYDKAQAALRSGVPLENVFTAMVRGGVSPQAAKYILAGKYVPYNLKGESIKAAVKQHGDSVPLEALVGIFSEYAGKDLGR